MSYPQQRYPGTAVGQSSLKNSESDSQHQAEASDIRQKLGLKACTVNVFLVPLATLRKVYSQALGGKYQPPSGTSQPQGTPAIQGISVRQCTIKHSRFLDASTQLYNRICPSVHPSVGRSVRRSVTCFFGIRENACFGLPRSLGSRGWQGEGVGGDEGEGRRGRG